MIRSAKINHPKIELIKWVDNSNNIHEIDPELYNGNSTVWVELKDGRVYGLSIYTPTNLQLIMNRENLINIIERGVIIVQFITQDTIIDAVIEVIKQGIEDFGILQE